MNWMILKLDDGRYQVVDVTTGTHLLDEPVENEDAAKGALRSMVDKAMAELAAADMAEESAGARFEAVFVEGEESVDGRVIDPDATNFNRTPPIPFMIMTEAEHGGMMMSGAAVCGVVDELARDGNKVYLRGNFDAGSDIGLDAQRRVADGVQTRWSPDMADMTVEWVCTKEDEDGFCIEELMHALECTIIGGTIVPKPALSSATVKIIGAAPSNDEEAGDNSTKPADGAALQAVADGAVDLATGAARRVGRRIASESLVASAIPVDPPADWFAEPTDLLPEPDRSIHITDDGRIYGYAALWGTCHVGVQGKCVDVPESQKDYAYFRTGSVKCSDPDCDLIDVGQITMSKSADEGGHCNDLRADYRTATEHYDNHCLAVADVTCGENEWGVWFSGALRPSTTPEQIRELRASGVSGDWRPVGGSSELIAMLAVNVQGFPVTRRVEREDEPAALVAAGGSPARSPEEAWRQSVERRLAQMEPVARALRGQAREALVASITEASEE